MASRIKLNGNELKRLKNDRKACDDICEDLERAKLAGVPGIEELQSKVQYLVDRIDKLLILSGDNK